MEIANIGKILSDMSEVRRKKEEEKSLTFGKTIIPTVSEESLNRSFNRNPEEKEEEPIRFGQTIDSKVIDIEQVIKMFNKFRQ